MVSLSNYANLTVLPTTYCIIRLENRLEEMERSHSIPSRWLPTDEEYKKSEYAVLLTKKEQILMQIWKSEQSRLFLLQLKRRYAGMWKL